MMARGTDYRLLLIGDGAAAGIRTQLSARPHPEHYLWTATSVQWRARVGDNSRLEPTKSGRTECTPNVRKAYADTSRETTAWEVITPSWMQITFFNIIPELADIEAPTDPSEGRGQPGPPIYKLSRDPVPRYVSLWPWACPSDMR